MGTLATAHAVEWQTGIAPTDAAVSIRKQVELSTIELFEAFGLAAECVASAPVAKSDAETVVAVIGYAASDVRGALVLAAPIASAFFWRATMAGAEVSADACDVLGEIANMLLGRLKGRLSAQGLQVLMTTPTAAQGAAVEIAPSETSKWMAFHGDHWDLAVRVDAAFDTDFRWHETLATTPAAPGALLMFEEEM
jgi:chemotaxis protein CheX